MRNLVALITLLLTAAGTMVAACTATLRNADYGVENGSSNSVSLTANVSSVGDLVAITGWCYTSCTPASVTLGNQTAVKTTVSGNPGAGDPGTGQGFIFYVLSAAASGQQTLTFTVNGSHSGIQTSYIDFSPSAGCSFVHNTDSPVGSGTGSTANTPSITPSMGDLLFNFTWSTEHVDSVNSPWSCPVYNGPGETQTCEFVNTVNAAGYILSASAGPTANNMTLIHSSDSWQALISSFSMYSGGGDPPGPPSNLVAVPR